MQINEKSIIKLIEIAASDENKNAYRSQSPQLIAFAVIGLIYAEKTNWLPTENISQNTKLELRRIAYGLNIDKIAYETFIACVRRMVRKICEQASEDEQILRIKGSSSERGALSEFLRFLAEKNIFTASHMRTWSSIENLAPLDLTRSTGDSARLRKSRSEKINIDALNLSADSHPPGELVLKIETSTDTKTAILTIAALKNSQDQSKVDTTKITENCRSYREMEIELDKLKKRIDFLQDQARYYFESYSSLD